MTAQYLWLLIFGICLYVISTDENVAKAFFYVFELVKTNIRKKWWWITHDPGNPVIKYMMYRKNLKLAEELSSKINKHTRDKQ